ncbi:MAG: nucleotidyltransferase domain-containing protein [Lachnospiraceae bacterium]|nr:nucleotidyltransferase domain-containing protein [Lachnospiraceae bacterium]
MVRTEQEIHSIINELCDSIRVLFGEKTPEAILFGSCARGDAEEGSDVDVMLLVDAPRSVIADKNWQVGDVAAELLLTHDMLVSPIVENRAYFYENMDALPFYRNVQREGVHIVG